MQTLKSVKNFAAKAHKNQVRKYTGEPYIFHPMDVFEILKNLYPKSTKEMLSAALLHDTVEDTDVTIDDVHTNFGPKVANLVYWLTDVSKPEDGNRAFRKNMDREHTENASSQAQIIKVADLISNSKSIVKHDKDFAKVYLKEKRLILDCMKDNVKNTAIWKKADSFLKDSLKTLSK